MEARASARADSSSSSSPARSRTRRGSTSTTRASSPSRSVTSSSLSASHGSHDSMPSNWSPSASRSHWWRPQGADPDQFGRPLPHGLVGHQLAAAEQLDPGQVVDRPLVGDVEPGQPVHLVAPQVDPDRLVGGGREHVDDAAPDGQLAAVLDDRLAPVAHAHQPGHQLVDVDLVALGHRHRPGRRPPRAEPLQDGLDRCDHDARWPALRVGAAQLPQQPETVAHGGHVGAHPLEGQGLPGREDLDVRPRAPVGAGEGGQIVGQLIGRGARWA